MPMKSAFFVLCIGSLFSLAACEKQQEPGASSDQQLKVNELREAPQIDAMTLAAPSAPAPPEAPQPGLPTDGTVPTVAPASSRKIIYHADVRVKVPDLIRANARMDSLTKAYGAYISDASEEREEGKWEHQMKIRVAPGQFQPLLHSLNGLGTLESKTLGTDDVTSEHADVSARLRTKRAVEQRYVALLTKARKIEDILAIEEKIGEVREEIESTESRLKTLNDQVSYSTINLSYYQVLALSAPDAPILSFSSRLAQAFFSGWELLTGLVLALVTAWPLLVLAAIGVVLVRAWRQRRRAAALPE